MKYLLLSIAFIAISTFQLFGQTSISGVIQTETAVPIHNVEVMAGSITANTDIFGNYLIENPELPTVVLPTKNDGPTNGVNVCDLLAMRNHIVGAVLLDSPYKIIAADINSSNSVTTLDLVKITRILLGIDESFTPNESWLFVDPNFVFPNPTNPFEASYPGFVVINQEGQYEMDFVGIKVGDVNNSALGSYPSTEVPDSDVLFFEIPNEVVAPQDEYIVEFTAKDFIEVFGFQFTLSYDPAKMEFIEIGEVTIANGISEVFNSNLVSPGILPVLWVNDVAHTIPDGDVVFTAKFKILENTNLEESLMFTSDYIQIVSTNSQGCFGEVGSPPFTTSTNDLSSVSSIEIFPNPTNGQFDFGMELNNSNKVEMEIFNVIGKRIFVKQYNGNLINDQIDIEKYPSGIYFLSVHIDGETITKRIVKS